MRKKWIDVDLAPRQSMMTVLQSLDRIIILCDFFSLPNDNVN